MENKKETEFIQVYLVFFLGSLYLRENMFDLVNEIVTFGPRMAHDDTIEALYYANLHAFPPNYANNDRKTKMV